MKFVVLFLAMILYACGGGGGSSGSSSSYSAQSNSGSSSSSSSSSSNSSSNTDSSSSSQTNTLYITKRLARLKNGSTREILKVKGANPIQTDGGLASEEERTIYGYDVIAESYTGTTWPIVEDKPDSQATIDVADGITASFSLEGNKLKINDSFIAYQFTGDINILDASGDGIENIWYAFNPDGTGTNTIGGLGNADNPTHRVTTPDAEQCSQVDNIFFCTIPENVIGEFSFCAKYCIPSDFRYEIDDSSGKWSINSDRVLSLEAQDYETMVVKFEQIDVKEISPLGEVIDYSVRFTITDVEEASGSSSSSSGGSITIGSTSFAADENQLSIGAISVSGPGNLTYELSGADSTNINIDNTGLLSFVGPPDFELKNSYSFVLKVSSDQSNVTAVEETINVSINDIGGIYENGISGSRLTNWSKGVTFNKAGSDITGSYLNDEPFPPFFKTSTFNYDYFQPWSFASVFKLESLQNTQTLLQISESNNINAELRESIKDMGFLSIEQDKIKFKYKPYQISEANSVNSNALVFLSQSILEINKWYGIYVYFDGDNDQVGFDRYSFDFYLVDLSDGEVIDITLNAEWTETVAMNSGVFTNWGNDVYEIGIDNFDGTIASIIATTHLTGHVPNSDEIKTFVLDPIKWLEDYRVGKNYRTPYNFQTGNIDVSTFYKDNDSSSSSTQIFLMGDGQTDSESTIYNQVSPSGSNNLTLNNVISFENIFDDIRSNN